MHYVADNTEELV